MSRESRVTLLGVLAFFAGLSLVEAWVDRAEATALAECSRRWEPRECRAALVGGYRLVGVRP